MKPRGFLATLAVATVGMSIWAAPTSWAQSHKTSHRLTRAASSATDPEFSALEQLAGTIDQLGENSYPTTYAGDQISNGVLDLYVITADDSSFLSAVATANSAGLPYTVVGATNSYASLDATSQWLATNETTLEGEGIAPGWWGASPADNAIRVALQSPTSAQLTNLQSAAAQLLPASMTVTGATYLTAAADVIKAQIPSPGDIVMYPTLLGPGQAASGYNDKSPFYGGDQIKYTQSNIETCTSNFSFNSSSNPSNHKAVTAAHCSGGASGHDFYTCASHNSSGDCSYNVGTVSSVYYNNQDFEVIPTSNYGYVWNDSNASLWSVNGWIDAEPGDYLTVDGEANGAHYDNYVTSGDGSTCVTYGGHTSCHAIVISTGSNELCIPGDSGGPVLERESDGYHIYAAGLILGYSNTGSGDFCYAQQVYWIRSQTNFQVVWGN